MLLGSCLACFADRAVNLWLGPNHFIGFGAVWVLLTMMLLEAHHLAVATATMATGKIVFVVPALLAGVINIVVSVFLAHRLGVVGVALGTLLAQLVTNNWYVPFYVLRQFHTSWRDHFRGVLAPVLLLLVTSLSAGAAARQRTAHLSDLSALVLGFLCIFSMGGTVVYILIFRPSDRAFLTARLLFPGAAKAL